MQQLNTQTILRRHSANCCAVGCYHTYAMSGRLEDSRVYRVYTVWELQLVPAAGNFLPSAALAPHSQLPAPALIIIPPLLLTC